MINKLTELILNQGTEILTLLTALILIINFTIKKIKRRVNIKMKRHHQYMLNDQEKEMILKHRAEEKEKLVIKEAEELEEIMEMMTPETIAAFEKMRTWVKKLLKGKKENKYTYNDEIDDLLTKLEKEKELKDEK